MTAPAPFVLDPATAADLTAGRWIGPERTVTIQGATLDSRAVTPGNLFACLLGERSDGHDHAAAAAGKGAAMVLASREVTVPIPQLLVADVTAALAALAREFRQRNADTTWIGVTGSNGKTTVKELLTAACAADGPTHATKGNLNNHLGVPVTVLATPAGTRYAVIEMGASAGGEIAHLAGIAQPTVGVITGLGPAHLEGFGGLGGVARGKSELFRAVPDGGRCLFGRHGLEANAAAQGVDADDLLDLVRTAAMGRHLVVVGDPGCAVDGVLGDYDSELRTPVGSVRVPLLGQHNLANAALAWHAAIAAGVAPALALRGLAAVQPGKGRLLLRRISGHLLYDDSYNANPSSMAAGLHVLARQPGARLAVLGAMGELGQTSADLHRQVGRLAASLGVSLLSVGAGAKPIAEGYLATGGRDHEHATDHAEAVAAVLARMRTGPLAVLVKASRSAGLDQVVRGVEQALGGIASDEDGH